MNEITAENLRFFLDRYATEYSIEEPRTMDLISIDQHSPVRVVTGPSQIYLTIEREQLELLVNLDLFYAKHSREAEIRYGNPAAKKAYEHYQTIIGLVK